MLKSTNVNFASAFVWVISEWSNLHVCGSSVFSVFRIVNCLWRIIVLHNFSIIVKPCSFVWMKPWFTNKFAVLWNNISFKEMFANPLLFYVPLLFIVLMFQSPNGLVLLVNGWKCCPLCYMVAKRTASDFQVISMGVMCLIINLQEAL